jgi:starch-binding outer membrane protein, SusD/RagB family
MKKVLYTLMIMVGLIMGSCEDLLDKTPLDQISDPQFWKSDGDLELYINKLYDGFNAQAWAGVGSGGGPVPDQGTDVIISEGNSIGTKNRMDGVVTVPTTGGGWSWTNVRNVNYFLDNAERVTTGANKDQYIGEGYFFRAWFYFDLLKQFGDLPIITKTLSVSDEDILYSARSSRTDVVNFIISDLDLAIAKMKPKSGVVAGRLHKDVALLFKSRVCLYEGTWEKYHQGTPFAGKTDGAAFLNLAATAAKAVIDGGNFSLTTGNTKTVYYELFNQVDLTSNKEVLFWKQYNYITYGDDFGNQMWNWPLACGYTREFVRSYLCTDGLPISLSPLYKGDADLRDFAVNRDPRCAQTIMKPGDAIMISLKNDTTKFVTPWLTGQKGPTGYETRKLRRPQLDPQRGDYSQDLAYIIFRYAEALLNYVEARAELGQLTQADVDLTINKLRQRVGMPNLDLSSITTDPDWPDYGYSLTPALQEIRRERKIELAAEGHRLSDIMRWRAHNLFVGKRPKGTKYTDEFKKINPNLKADSEGYLDPYNTPVLTGPGGTWGFNPAKHYLLPLPVNELTINPNLKQNPGY